MRRCEDRPIVSGGVIGDPGAPSAPARIVAPGASSPAGPTVELDKVRATSQDSHICLAGVDAGNRSGNQPSGPALTSEGRECHHRCRALNDVVLSAN